jgi:hypothetical protein
MATTTAAQTAPAAAARSLSLRSQFRFFFCLSSGMFSMSALALAFLDHWGLGSAGQAATYFMATVVAAGLFGIATVLEFGPDQA